MARRVTLSLLPRTVVAASPHRQQSLQLIDALAASPFAVLDAHGSLRLVTDVVHEDDALCFALACCAMRDALGVARVRVAGR